MSPFDPSPDGEFKASRLILDASVVPVSPGRIVVRRRTRTNQRGLAKVLQPGVLNLERIGVHPDPVATEGSFPTRWFVLLWVEPSAGPRTEHLSRFPDVAAGNLRRSSLPGEGKGNR